MSMCRNQSNPIARVGCRPGNLCVSKWKRSFTTLRAKGIDRNGMRLSLGYPPTILTSPKNYESVQKPIPDDRKIFLGARIDYSAKFMVSHLAFLVFCHQKWSLERIWQFFGSVSELVGIGSRSPGLIHCFVWALSVVKVLTCTREISNSNCELAQNHVRMHYFSI